jgi:hypothetical protein
MTFLNPWLIAGAAAIAAPIIIHLMMRQQDRRIKWAAMRFLQAVVQRNERKLRIEDRLLLVLRCILLVLIALALARPAFRAPGTAPALGAHTIVIALDNSRGMGLSDGGSSRLDNGRKAAAQIIDALPAGSSAALLEFSDVARPVIAEPAADLNLVRRLIGQVQLTDRASNVHPALRLALDILQRHGAGRGEIYLITGAQATGWKELPAMRNDAGKSGAQIHVVVPEPGEQPHIGISDLVLGSAMLPAGEAVRYSIEATNYGHEDAHNVTVGLGIDLQPPSDQAVITLLSAGQSRRVSLFAKADGAGYHAITAQVPPDHLPADNRRTIVVRALEEVRVLLVAGQMGATPAEGDAFFLERALAPVAAEERKQYFIKTQTIAAGDIDAAKLTDYDAVALVDVSWLDQPAVAGLDNFVRKGGGLMIFPGEQTDAAFYNTALGEGLGLLPAIMGDPWGDSTQRAQFHSLQAAGYNHPVVSIWQDPAAGTLTSARFFKGLTLEPLRKQNAAAGDSVTILTYTDGAPAIVERTWGSGRVIEFSSSANTAWNDLPARPAFVPLMQRALGRLVTRREEALNIGVGSEFIYPARVEWLYHEMLVTAPGAPPGNVDKSKVELVKGQPLLRNENTDHAGLYDVEIASQPAARLLFAAEADPASANLTPIPDNEIVTLAPGTQVIHWTPETNMAQALAREGSGSELWPVLAVLALAVACCETFVAGRFSASK